MKDVRPQNVEENRIIDANNRLKERVEAKRYKRIIKLNAFADKYEKLLNYCVTRCSVACNSVIFL